ncbi:MAG TPA: hypothetical protein VID67_04465 [Rhizomicrobium sp.]|jgi:hypothetical protein
MSSQKMRASGRADALDHARQQNIERQLERFRPKLRPAVRALAMRHPRLAELSESFPALVIALAWPRAGVDTRAIINAVILGAPLNTLAKFAGVPLWLRRIPTEMLVAPLPVLPDSPFIRHRILNHLPRHPKHAKTWFRNVSEAAKWSDDAFAVWIAANMGRERRNRVGRVIPERVRLLSLWAWYSRQPETLGYRLMKTRWNPDMQLKAANDAAYDWRDGVEAYCLLGERVATNHWHRSAEVDGYNFVSVCTVEELSEEAVALQNCLASYGDSVATGESQIWSIRKDGARIAVLEMTRRSSDPYPFIGQLFGAKNNDAPREVWLAAHRWLASQPQYDLGSDARRNNSAEQRTNWRALWRPYWMAKRCVPAWLPLAGTSERLYYL